MTGVPVTRQVVRRVHLLSRPLACQAGVGQIGPGVWPPARWGARRRPQDDHSV